jgi:TorA maturation chaperone TorD
MDSKEKILYEKQRGDCFRLLAACFYKPQKEIFLQEKVFQSLTSLLEQVCPDATHFSNKMGDSILKYTEEELSVEYAKLFVGPYELKAPPYGSVYLDDGRRVMGDSTIEVIRMYQEVGLTMDESFKELPDHIAVELEFIYFLTYGKVNALEKSELDRARSFQEARNVFFNNYLRKWVPVFCDKIITNTDNAFYIALADCLSTFLSQFVGLEDYQTLCGGKRCDLSMS